MSKLSIFACCVTAMAFLAPMAAAQEGPGGVINPSRDCQTVLTCNFSKHGSYRGCLSSYSCRVCAFVPAKCKIAGARSGTCQRLKCTWGG